MANYEYITRDGLIVPDTSTLKAEVEAEFRAVFGNDIQLDPSTPAGMLVARVVETRDFVIRNNVAIANQINPEFAGGVFLDAILGMSGLQRGENTHTLVPQVAVVGTPGTFIPMGSKAKSEAGDIFESITDTTIPGLGFGLVDFKAIEPGHILCAKNTLINIVDAIPGWDSINNVTYAGIPGSIGMSDTQARQYRRDRIAKNGQGSIAAITSAIMSLEGVHSMTMVENTAATTADVHGVSNMPPHSVWVCVYGGQTQDIGEAIFNSKPAGTPTWGTIPVTVPDGFGHDYTMWINRADAINIYIRVTVKDPHLWINIVTDLVMNYVEGRVEGDQSFRVGVDVSPWEIAGALNQQRPDMTILKVEVGKVGEGLSTDVYPININQVAVLEPFNIQVV